MKQNFRIFFHLKNHSFNKEVKENTILVHQATIPKSWKLNLMKA